MNVDMVPNDIKSICQNKERETEGWKHTYEGVAHESERKAASALTEEFLRNPE